MRIIGISGLWCLGDEHHPIAIWEPLCDAFRRHFPGADLSVQQRYYIRLWHLRRLRRFVDDIAENIDTEGDVLLVGHSLGGVIACAVAARVTRANIAGVVTVFSPHRFPFNLFPRLLRAPKNLAVSVISFGAKRDRAVWWGTKHWEAVEHHVLDCNHFSEFQEKDAEEVARISAKHFLPVRNE